MTAASSAANRRRIVFGVFSAPALIYTLVYLGAGLRVWWIALMVLAAGVCVWRAPAVYTGIPRGRRAAVAVFAALLSAALTLQGRILYSGVATDSYRVNRFLPIGAGELALWVSLGWLLFTGALCLLGFMRWRAPAPARRAWKPGAFFGVSLLTLTAAWGVYWLTYYPGNVMVDSYWILRNPVSLSMNHPYFYILLLTSLVSLGERLTGTANGGLALYSVLQIVLVAACVSACLTWMKRRGCRRWYLAAALLLFAVSPFFAHTASYVVKDVIFSAVMLLYVPLLFDLLESRGTLLRSGAYLAKFIGVSTVVCLMRYNGYFIVAAIVFCMLLCFLKMKRLLILPLVGILCFGAALPYGANQAAMKYIAKNEYLFQESVAIPLQQIARTVVAENGVIPDDLQAFVFSLYSRDFFERHYAPMSSDPIKWSSDPETAAGKIMLQHNRRAFLTTWLRLLPKNAEIYFEAYAMQTYGYWSLAELLYTQPEADTPEMVTLGMQRTQIWSEPVQKALEWFYTACYGALSEGLMVWCTAWLALAALVLSGPRNLLPFVPAAALWVSLMLGAPVAFLLRYVYYLAYALPVTLFITLHGQTRRRGEDALKPGAAADGAQ